MNELGRTSGGIAVAAVSLLLVGGALGAWIVLALISVYLVVSAGLITWQIRRDIRAWQESRHQPSRRGQEPRDLWGSRP